MLQELANGHIAEACVCDVAQIQDGTDRLVETNLARLDQLENTNGGELYGKAADSKKIGRLGRNDIRWGEGVSMVKDQFAVQEHRPWHAGDDPERQTDLSPCLHPRPNECRSGSSPACHGRCSSGT